MAEARDLKDVRFGDIHLRSTVGMTYCGSLNATNDNSWKGLSTRVSIPECTPAPILPGMYSFLIF